MTDHAPVTPVLEPGAPFAVAIRTPTFLFQMAPAGGRKALEKVHSGSIAEPDVDEECATVTGGPTGEVGARIVRPAGVSGATPATPAADTATTSAPRQRSCGGRM
ncbi:hypothetical protein ABZZ17_38860 [Streptomyces sp. NPDC006512]|uniref:hypothetical protein n=1 Tax=Streptomyces sp. NPDC006512 TaxID=3154307 RepID=UPI0033AB2675